MPRSLPSRLVAISLAASVLGLSSAGPLLAQSPSGSRLSGRVLAANGSDARAGVVVALVDTKAEKIFRSSPTDARGAFRVDAPAAGRYALVVEAPEGAFLASDGLDLAAGANRPVSLALKPAKGRQAPPPGEPPPASPPPAAGLPSWAKWVIAGGIVVGAAIVVDAVTSDDEASDF